MSNYEKLIKQATKPKPGAPKSKYIDPIIASSFSQDGSLQDICRAIAARLSDSSSLVVFRSLIVIHTLIRNGGIDNVMTHLASNQSALKLRNVVAGGNWQGYDASRMLTPYAAYIDERIKAYRELRRDVIRTSSPESSSSRSRSNSNGAGNEGSGSGQRLRRLTVEKGLLREVSIAQKVCNRLLDLFFAYFSDNTQDEMAMTAFRMALKDMLAIYAAINEGVINILEHYFEMSKPDATRALDIYKRFCVHTEKIVAYMTSAKKVSFSLAVPIPNLRHAPVSLAGALQEYLDDPNFENNRLEYKENKRIVDSGGSVAPKAKTETKTEAKKSISIQEPSAEQKTKPVKPPTSNQAIQDFFGSIETDQMSMFAGPPQQQQQQQFILPQATGYNPFMNGGAAFMMPQQTGFMQPQQTGFFPMQQTGFMQPQQTGFLQPQMTGYNPFRQSVMPQATGMNGFGSSFASPSPSMSPAPGAPSSSQPPSSPSIPVPTRSATAPIKPLSAQKTGSRNPFAPPPGERVPTPPPAGPKGPSLRELAFGGMGSNRGPSAGGGGTYSLGASAWSGNANGQQIQTETTPLQPQKTGIIGSVASEFFKGANTGSTSISQPVSPAPAPVNSTNDFNSSFSTLSVQPSQPTRSSTTLLEPQATGFGGSTVKPFQPTSSFGASLLSPSPSPIPANMTGNPFARMPDNPSTPSQPASVSNNTAPPTNQSNGNTSQPTGFGSSFFANGNSNGVAAQPTGFGSSLFGNGSTTPSNLQAQPTGYGSSLFSSTTSNSNQLTAQPTGFGGSTVKPFQPSSAFGSAAFANTSVPQPQQQQQSQQQQTTVTGSFF